MEMNLDSTSWVYDNSFILSSSGWWVKWLNG